MDPPTQGRPPLRPGDGAITQGLLLGVVLCSFFSIALMQIGLGLAFGNWVWGLRRGSEPRVRGPLAIPMIGFLSVSLVSALLSGDAYAAKDAVSGGLPMLGYWMTLNVMAKPARLRRSLVFVVAGGVLAAVLGLIQAAFESRGLRIAGSLSHYMTFSGVLMLAGSIALTGMATDETRRARGLWGAALVPILCALLLTETRGSWVGLAAAAAVVLALRRPRLLPLLPIAVALVYLVSPGHVQERIRSTFDPGDFTANQRFSMWSVGRRMIADHPLFGVGPRRTDEEYERYRPADDPFRSEPTPGHLHNNVVQTAAERGLVGLAFWLAIWIAWFYRAGRLYAGRDRGDPLASTALAASLAAMTAFQVMGFFEFNAGDSEVATLAMFVMAFPFAVEGLRTGAPESGVAQPTRLE